MMKVFIDTEFTDFLSPTLISIGLVADNGEEFYAELPVERACSDFVKEIVLPLLGREPHADCQIFELRRKLLTWFQIVRRKVEDVLVIADHVIDLQLLTDAFDHCVPSWVNMEVAESEIKELLLEEFFNSTGLPQHHALYDARANCYAYRPHPDRQCLAGANLRPFQQCESQYDA